MINNGQRRTFSKYTIKMETTENKNKDRGNKKVVKKKKKIKRWWENSFLYTAIGVFKGIRKI